LSAACRAGAIVLLVGFWFDGGLLIWPRHPRFGFCWNWGVRGTAKYANHTKMIEPQKNAEPSPSIPLLSMGGGDIFVLLCGHWLVSSRCWLSCFFLGALLWAKEHDRFPESGSRSKSQIMIQ